MDLIETLPNILAMISSLVAMFFLNLLSPKIGGSLGKMLKLFIIGIFFAVFLHAASEFLNVFGIINEEVLFPIMGFLLTVGSIFFVFAALVGLKSFK